VSGGCLGAGVGAGSCAAPPFRAPTEDIDHMDGCPAWAECCTEYGYCHPKSNWLAGEFRDCNGESNGTPLPLETRQKEAICSGEATEEDFAEALINEEGSGDENSAKLSGVKPTSSSINNIGLPPLNDIPSTSVSSIGPPDGLYLSPGAARQGRRESSSVKRPTPSGFRNKNSFQSSSTESKHLEDRITEILQIKNGFASFNRDSSNSRNWSGWRGVSNNSSRNNGVKIRRGRFRKINSDTKDFSQIDLSQESQSPRKHNGSCEWDLVRGGCRVLNGTSTRLQRLPSKLPSRINVNKAKNLAVSDIFMRCENKKGCQDGFVKVTTEESIHKEEEKERPRGKKLNRKTNSQNVKQIKNDIKKLIGLKTNVFSHENERGLKTNKFSKENERGLKTDIFSKENKKTIKFNKENERGLKTNIFSKETERRLKTNKFSKENEKGLKTDIFSKENKKTNKFNKENERGLKTIIFSKENERGLKTNKFSNQNERGLKTNIFSDQNEKGLQANKFSNENERGIKTNIFSTGNARDVQIKTNQFNKKKQEIVKFVEKKSSNEIRKTINQINKRIEGTKSVLDIVKIIQHETMDEEDGFERSLPGKNRNDERHERKGKKSGTPRDNNDETYPVGRNGWDGPKPNCAWDGPGACLKNRNKSKKNIPKKNNQKNINKKNSNLKKNNRKGKKIIDTIAAINNFRNEKDDNRENFKEVSFREEKNFVESRPIKDTVANIKIYEKDTRESNREDNVVIEKSRFINLFPKRLKALDFKNMLNTNQSKASFEKTTEKPVKTTERNKNEFDRSQLFPGKTIRERIKENLRQRERERNKLVGFTIPTIKSKLKNVKPTKAIKTTKTTTLKTNRQTTTKKTNKQPTTKKTNKQPTTKKTNQQPTTKKTKKQQQAKKQQTAKNNKTNKKQKEREGRSGLQVWSVEEWLRRG